MQLTTAKSFSYPVSSLLYETTNSVSKVGLKQGIELGGLAVEKTISVPVVIVALPPPLALFKVTI